MSKTVRVRIAVAVCPDGEWAAAGNWEYSGEAIRDIVFIDELPGSESWHWIEADIPLPKPQTIEGEVVS